MGCVYRAQIEGPAGASKHVALKVIHAHLAEDQDFVLMFLDEMRVAMALSHRNIVQTFDAGETDEHYYMVMELVSGCSLRSLLARLKGRPLPLDIAIFIGQEVAAALAYAHRFQAGDRTQPGVVHRDLSPSNVLLSAEGDVKLADFGVAKAAGRLYVTKVNMVRGKMQYMAPEQASGQTSTQSDIYSLGAVLYKMVTGKPVRKTARLDEIALSGLPPPPSSVGPGIPPALDQLILGCLNPEPSARPAGADQVRQELAAVSFELRSNGQSLDDHARLKGFLAELSAEPPRRAGSPRLAQLVLEQARAMETDPELELSGDDEVIDGEAETETLTAGAGATKTKTLTFDGDASTPVADEDEPGALVDTVKTPPENRSSNFGDDFDSTSSTFGSETTGAETAPHDLRRVEPKSRHWVAIGAGVALILIIGVVMLLLYARDDEDAGLLADVERAHEADARALRSDQAVVSRPEPDLARAVAIADARQTPVDAPVVQPRKRPRSAPRTARRYGYLDINAMPWAKVYIDGRYRGETPLEGQRLRAGVHMVRLVSPSRGLSRTYRVRVQADKRQQRVFNLQRR